MYTLAMTIRLWSANHPVPWCTQDPLGGVGTQDYCSQQLGLWSWVSRAMFSCFLSRFEQLELCQTRP